MPPYLTRSADPFSSSPDRVSRQAAASRANLAAGTGVALVIAQLAVAQLTLGLAAIFMIIGRLSRWRPLWLIVPAVTGLGWVAVIGAGRAATGYLAAGSHLVRLAAGPGELPARLSRLGAVVAGWRHWLPGQLPLALIVAAAEAGIACRLRAHGRYRAGVLVAARRAYVGASVRRGEVATPDGGCIGLIEKTGRRVVISWREAEGGILVTGQDTAAVTATGMELAVAAIQHRKTVIIIDLTGGAARGARLGSRSAADAVPEMVAAASDAAHAPLAVFGAAGGHYEPFSAAGPARAAGLVAAMIDWAGASPGRPSPCTDYLRTVLEVIAAAPAHPQRAILDDVAGLLRPGALQARLREWPGSVPGGGALIRRAAELSGQIQAEQAAMRAAAARLAGLRRTAVGARLCQPGRADGEAIYLARALAEREVVLFALGDRIPGRPGVMVARLVLEDLAGILAERADLGARGDCLVWINGCEAAGEGRLAALLAVGPRAGAIILAGTAAGQVATWLTDRVNVVAVRGRPPTGLGRQVPTPAGQPRLAGAGSLTLEGGRGLDAARPAAHDPGALSLRVRDPLPRLVTGCRAVR